MKQINALLNRKVNRKEFLQTSALLLATSAGIAATMKELSNVAVPKAYAATNPLRATNGPWLPNITPELVDDFTSKSDGNLNGMSSTSGHVWQATGNIPMVIKDSVLTDISSVQGAGYGLLQASKSISYMAAEFCFSTGSADGALGIISFPTNNFVIGSTISPSPCHLVITPNAWIYSVIDSNNNFIQVATKNYSARLATDGQTLYSVEVIIDSIAKQAYLRLPDGSIVTVSHAAIGQSANWFCIENYYNADSSTKPRTTQIVAHSYPIGRDSHATTIRALALALQPAPPAQTTPTWINATVTAPYVSQTAVGRPLQYYKDAAGRVFFRGMIKTNGGKNTNTLMTLPAGYRPPTDCRVVVANNSDVGYAMDILATGVVRPVSTVDRVYWMFDNVSFAAI